MTPLTLAPRTRGVLLRRIESMSVRGMERHWRLIPPETARRLRPRVARVGDGIMTRLETSNALRMNRVIGLGHRGRARETMIDEIVEWYRTAGLERFSFHVSPGPQAIEIRDWLSRRGFKPQVGHALLLRDGRQPVPRVASAARVTRVGPAQASVVVDINERCFGSPASRRAWSLAAAKAPRYEHFVARVGKKPVGAGALQVAGDLAWLGGGATLTAWRKRGVHSALIAARLRRASQRGCRWVWVETLAPTPGRPDGSRRNLLRLGFEPVCLRPIYLWQE